MALRLANSHDIIFVHPFQPPWITALFYIWAPVGNEFTKDGEHAFNRAICTQVCNIEMKPSTHTCWHEPRAGTWASQWPTANRKALSSTLCTQKPVRNGLWTCLGLKDQLSEENKQVTRWNTPLFQNLLHQCMAMKKWDRDPFEPTSSCRTPPLEASSANHPEMLHPRDDV